MSKKWAHLRGTLDGLPDKFTTERRERINSSKDSAVSENNDSIAKLYQSARDLRDKGEGIKKSAQENMDAYSEVLVSRFEAENIESVRTASGLLTRTDKPRVVVTDKTALLAWVKSSGLSDLLTINTNTLQALTTERLESGDPLPDGVDLYLQTSVSFRR